MKSRKLATISMIAGAVVVLVGMVLQFAVIPAQAQVPDDVERPRVYEGDVSVMLNAEALATGDLANVFLRDVPITIDRVVETLEVDGSSALVSDVSVLNGPVGPIQASEDVYAIDRKSMEHIDNFTDDDRVIDREGLVVGFPIGTEQQDYLGFNGDTLELNTLTYVGTSEVNGLATYEFSAASGPDVITDPVLLESFPAALPQALIQGLLPALGLPDEAVAQFAQLLPTLPDPVPLTYTYSYETAYQVEPDSGMLVDYNKVESRVAVISVGDQVIPVTEVMNLTYELSDASIVDAVGEAEDAQSLLFWVGKVLPYTAIAIGAVLLLFGILMMALGPKGPASSGTSKTIDLTDEKSEHRAQRSSELVN
jgi:hypothetical protein